MRSRTCITTTLIAVALLLAGPATVASGAAKRRTVSAVVATALRNPSHVHDGCVPAMVSIPAPTNVRGLAPAPDFEVGESLWERGEPAWRIKNVHVSPTEATWELHPLAACRHDPADPGWYLSLQGRARSKRYELLAPAGQPVRRIAGFRVDGVTRATAPTARRAIRALGRPSRIKRGRAPRGGWPTSCTITWNRLGLRIEFNNYGWTRDICKGGFAQHGTITRMDRWAIRVGDDLAVTRETPLHMLDWMGHVDREDGAWVLDRYRTPYGDQGLYPSIALYATTVRHPIRRATFWIGKAGD
ncbi:MAG: hypothetical protein M0P31_17510 [Solirubrobacteraceae bacterium]|nr:hypothetical protein [Solirubrobacteraceae bacterium]